MCSVIKMRFVLFDNRTISSITEQNVFGYGGIRMFGYGGIRMFGYRGVGFRKCRFALSITESSVIEVSVIENAVLPFR